MKLPSLPARQSRLLENCFSLLKKPRWCCLSWEQTSWDPSQLSSSLPKLFSSCTFLLQERDLAQGFTSWHAETAKSLTVNLQEHPSCPEIITLLRTSSWMAWWIFHKPRVTGYHFRVQGLLKEFASLALCLPDLSPKPQSWGHFPLTHPLQKNLSSAFFFLKANAPGSSWRAGSVLPDLAGLCSRLHLHAKHLTLMKTGTNKTAC